MIPSVRSTWAPRGQTPVIRHKMHWDKYSMAALIGFHSDGERARLLFELRRGAFNEDAFVEMIGHLRRAFRGQNVTLVWDNLGAHKGRRMRECMYRHRRWLRVEFLPAYAPELNPVEGLWSVLKGTNLANLGAVENAEVIDVARRGLRRLQRRQSLLHGLRRKAGLALGINP